MIKFAWESGAELECTECGERFDEEDLLTIDDPSNILRYAREELKDDSIVTKLEGA